MVAMVYIAKNISYIIFAKVTVHNCSYYHVIVRRFTANVNMYKCLHVPNSIKPKIRHNDKF